MLFVDFKAAYDSVVRRKLWYVLSLTGISEKLIRIIKAYVKVSKCKVSFGEAYSNEFTVPTGLKQGDFIADSV